MISQVHLVAVAVLMFGLMPVTSVVNPKPPSTESKQKATPEAMSLLGEPLDRPLLPEELHESREAQLAEARQALEDDPEDEQRLIWVGRRLAYLGRYRDAVEVYSKGLEKHPRSYKLRRHRGHRYITLRQLDKAIRDLSEAAKLIQGVPDAVEPDGLPNALNQPTGTSHTNIYYHLALAHYLKGELAAAAQAWHSCLEATTNDDMRCAAAYWRYLSLAQLGREEDAATVLELIHDEMTIIENHAYHQLLMLYKGALTPDDLAAEAEHLGPGIGDATLGYGLAMWHALRGEHEAACREKRALLHSDAWAAFGSIAAEADIARGECPDETQTIN